MAKNNKKNYSTRKNDFGANNKDRNQQPAKTKTKPESATYHKTFDTFDEAAQEILSMPGYLGPALSEYLPYEIKTAGDPVSVSDMEYAMISLFRDNYPDIENKKNQFWTLSLSLDRALMKTNHFIQVGYILNKKYENGRHTITSVDVTVTLYNTMKTVDEINFFEEKSWARK